LKDDHANARMLADAVAGCEAAEIDLAGVQTNIVIFRLKAGGAAELVAGLKAKGVLCSAIGPDSVRLVTHFDVSREDCEKSAELIVDALRYVQAHS